MMTAAVSFGGVHRPSGDPVERAAAHLTAGRVVVVVDDGPVGGIHLVAASASAAAETLAFLIRHGSGIVVAAVTEATARRLRLGPMVGADSTGPAAAFTVTVDATHGVSTGISAADRARTARVLGDPDATPDQLSRPGHVMPVLTHPDGVVARPGPAEAAVDLAGVAGVGRGAVSSQLVSAVRPSLMASAAEGAAFAAKHGLPVVTISDLVRHRLATDRLVERVASTRLPLPVGDFTAVGYRGVADGAEYLALVHGAVDGAREVLTHLHRECVTGDVFGSLTCGSRVDLQDALRAVVQRGSGVVVYLRSDGGIAAELRAYRSRSSEVDPGTTAGTWVGSDRERQILGQIEDDLGVVSSRAWLPAVQRPRLDTLVPSA